MGNKASSVKVLMVGLDNSGKTTALNSLMKREGVETKKSVGYNVDEIKFKKHVFEVFDVAGEEKVRQLWRHYFDNKQALIFVVDSNDRDRLPEAAKELGQLLMQPDLNHLPLLVLANKKDLPNALKSDEIIAHLELKVKAHSRQWHVIETNALNGEGLGDGLQWFVELFKQLEKERKHGSPAVQSPGLR
eukprot:TRINITY_DN227_c0_g1_i3.p1 TRINITY_DN227_c0_g1~~TRINITY_DN227_c0_g1_i3.p1  ORF type:complete len:189 (-),score=18.41 TRINITY_DN227_c0_g1_i3:200-766(-)